MMAYLIGIDLGTSSLKTMLADEAGGSRVLASVDYQFDVPYAGYAEQDANIWWDALVRTVRKVLQDASVRPEEIAGISFSGQMHGIVPIDREGKCIRPAILHCDARSATQVEEINKTFGIDRIRELMMNPVYSGFLLVSLLWIRENEPQNYERIHRVLSPKDYLKYRLTGICASEPSDASATLAYDIRKGTWSEEILERLKIDKDLFPKIIETDGVVGSVTESAARETGLSVQTLVVSGGGDQVMQGVGNGVTAVGAACVNIGTSGQYSIQSDEPILNPALSTNTFCGYKKGRWFTMGAIMNAGLCMKWGSEILKTSSYEEWNEAAKKTVPGSGGVIFLPYLNGERTPHVNPNLSGALWGVNLKTGRAEVMRAIMEGVVFALNECKEICAGLGLAQRGVIVSSGGGARSREWLQMQADILGAPLKVASVQEQACMGAVITAGSGAGIFKDIEEGCRACVTYSDEVIEPDQQSQKIYREYYGQYLDLMHAAAKQLEAVTILGRETEKVMKQK